MTSKIKNEKMKKEEQKFELNNKQNKMEKEETKNGTVMTTNMNKYLELSFENAGLIVSDNGRNVSNRFVEPITIFQVSNVIHKLFGERPVPTFRQSNIPIIGYLYNKASESYLKIDNILDQNGNFIKETFMKKNGGVGYISFLKGKIFVPITEYDIEKIKKGPGTATILDGGLVRIEGILNEEDLPDDIGRKVSEISTKQLKNGTNYATINYDYDHYFIRNNRIDNK